ncbi:MAG TPA: S41 family peptidase [Isosphaeraceae bacterium]|nr:S41 family peptidase [Isosphaeraceae bacterium]
MWHSLDIATWNSSLFTSLLAEWAIKGFLIFAAATALTVALRRKTAAVRHLVWTLAMLAALGLPLLSGLLPSWRLSVPVAFAPEAVAVAPQPQHPFFPSPFDRLSAATPTEGSTPGSWALPAPRVSPAPSDNRMGETALTEPPASPRALFSGWIPGLWAAGSLTCFLPVVIGLLSLLRLDRSSRPVTSGPAYRLLQELAAPLGQGGSIRLVESRRRSMPMTWGLWRPVILLPVFAQSWTEERLKMVILHELAHVTRKDFATQLAARLACALHWFNPLAWLALARIGVEQERACDDLALAAGLDPSDYAGHLLAIVAGHQRGVMPAIASAMASSSQVERRLRSILDPSRDRRPPSRRHIAIAALSTALLLAPLATGRVESAAPTPTDEPAAQKSPREEAKEPPVSAKDQAQVLEQLKRLYVRPPDEAALINGAIKGMIDALNDPYSSYIRPDEYAELERTIGAELTGIGVQLKLDDGRAMVEMPLPESPAEKVGIQAGDEILEVDSQPTKGAKLTELVRRIVGPAGSVVKLKVAHRDGKEVVLDITRGAIRIRTVVGPRPGDVGRGTWMIDPDNKVGYTRIVQFAPATAGELKDAIRSLQDQGMKGMILDLRSCPGGMLQAALDVANLFLREGPIISARGRDGAEVISKADPDKYLGAFPLVILINEQTASAAEVTAGALQARDRAILVGTRTVGKGSIQSIVKLDQNGGAIKLTTAYYTLPDGRNIDKAAGKTTWGIDPTEGDFVPMDIRELEMMQKTHPKAEQPRVGGAPGDRPDAQLSAALKTMTAKLTTGEFSRVGQPPAALIAYVNRLEEIRKRRDALRQDLEKVEKELGDLSKPQTEPSPPGAKN